MESINGCSEKINDYFSLWYFGISASSATRLIGGECMIEDKAIRPRGTDSAKVIQVIVTESLVGRGTEEDPCYIQKRYWSLDGILLATSS